MMVHINSSRWHDSCRTLKLNSPVQRRDGRQAASHVTGTRLRDGNLKGRRSRHLDERNHRVRIKSFNKSVSVCLFTSVVCKHNLMDRYKNRAKIGPRPWNQIKWTSEGAELKGDSTIFHWSETSQNTIFFSTSQQWRILFDWSIKTQVKRRLFSSWSVRKRGVDTCSQTLLCFDFTEDKTNWLYSNSNKFHLPVRENGAAMSGPLCRTGSRNFHFVRCLYSHMVSSETVTDTRDDCLDVVSDIKGFISDVPSSWTWLSSIKPQF